MDKWLKQHGYTTTLEQHLPELDLNPGTPDEERAIMDIVAVKDTSTHWIDVSVTNPLSHETATCGATPHTHNAARRREQDKHRRYPHSNLIPFVVEAYGWT